ncbi:SusC/RagA family TonB-linked outer membrane protein [Sphingobacterium arenae]|uniref:TonB-dependent receptor n=1 Tax=Sphingobacterium arenae TaxID=1280598 RepID=A0ABR7Y514_9SPHI|nr:TonB-dependent receptor [Sphingobacterium arenae]MBD1426381.1 TonB-dependent receptor [Sphingobacterium arenae]
MNTITDLTKKRALLLMFCFCLAGGHLSARHSLTNATVSSIYQDGDIRGKVTDETGRPISGVTVSVQGASKEVTTDAGGNYRLDDVPQNAVLVFTYVGFRQQQIAIDNRNIVDIQLTSSSTELDQVVVVGYGTEKQENITGSIATINMEDNEGRPLTNVSNALYGTSGLYVNLNTSQPGVDRAMIRIRGIGTLNNNNPLVLVDGIEYPMDEVNPNDIASISVLKDASAAIYGSKAANGVILITTKRGKGKSKIDYGYYHGIQQATMMLDLVWDPIVYMKALNQAEFNEGKASQTFSEQDIGGYQLGMTLDPYTYPANNWYDIAFKNGIMNKHDLSASGSSEKYNYRFSVGYLDRDGVIFGPGNQEKRYSLGLNTSAKVTERLTVDLSMHGYFRNYTEPAYGIGEFMSLVNRALPLQNDLLADGNYGYPFLRIPGRNNWEHPRMLAHEGSQEKRVVRYLTTLQAKYELPFGLSYTVKFGADKYDGLLERFVPVMYKLDAKTGERQNYNSPATAPRSYSYDDNQTNVHIYNTLDYKKTFGDHDIGAMLGSQYDYYEDIATGAQMQGYADDILTDLNAGTVLAEITGRTTQEAIISYFGRVNYNFKNRYLLEGIFRYDGSSRFAPGYRWGFFPGVSAGWKIDQEPFFENINFVDQLKLRASVGQVGNQAVPLYSYQNMVTLGHDYSFGGRNGVLTSGAAATAANDPTISWETTTNYNAGLDLLIFNNKLSFTADVYKRLTSGILRRVSLPSQVGNLSGPQQNVGTVSNAGVELSLGYRDVLENGLGYSVFGNVSYNKNKVVDLKGEIIYGHDTNLPTITKEGYPINAFYVLNVEGIFQSDEEVEQSAFQSGDTRAGYLKYEDVNKDGIINGDDRVIQNYSSIMPKYNYSFGFNLDYKGVTLMAQFQGVSGIKTAPLNRPATPLNNGANLTWDWINDSWTPERPNASLPILTEANYSDNFRFSTFLLKDASYLRLKTLQLRYAIPERILSKVKINALSVYVNAENWLTFTPFKLGDPESMYNAVGLSHYPMLRTLSMGLNFTF